MEDKINKIIAEAKADAAIEGFQIDEKTAEDARNCLDENDDLEALINQVIQDNI